MCIRDSITVDGQVVNIPSYAVKPGQLIGVRERSKSLEVIANSLAGFNHSKYAWLEWDEASKAVSYTHLVQRKKSVVLMVLIYVLMIMLACC